MPIQSSAVGQPLTPATEDITPRQLLAYAAGIGDTSPAVFDDSLDLVAHPAFCVSLEWPVVSNPETRDRLGASGDELLRGVHATQDSIFERPIRPGMRLTTEGRTTAMRTTRAGTLGTSRLDTSDPDGPVVRSYYQTMYRGVDLEGGDVEEELPPPVPDFEVGEAWQTDSVFIPLEMPHIYTECARIWNPIHTERKVAAAAGLPDWILHGTATWALAGREILARHADGQPARLRRLRGRFRAMVLPGTRIEICHQAGSPLPEGTPIAFRVRNAEGQDAIEDGFALIS